MKNSHNSLKSVINQVVEEKHPLSLQVHPIIQNYTKPSPTLSSNFLQEVSCHKNLETSLFPSTKKEPTATDHTFWYATLHRYATSALPLVPHSHAAAHQQTLPLKRLGSRETSPKPWTLEVSSSIPMGKFPWKNMKYFKLRCPSFENKSHQIVSKGQLPNGAFFKHQKIVQDTTPCCDLWIVTAENSLNFVQLWSRISL